MMSNYEGGTLVKIKNHVKKNHSIINKSKRYDLPKQVNSYHNYTIKNLSNSFDVISTCNKGSIEAISHLKYKWLGWMWHPERDKVFNNKLLLISKTVRLFPIKNNASKATKSSIPVKSEMFWFVILKLVIVFIFVVRTLSSSIESYPKSTNVNSKKSSGT